METFYKRLLPVCGFGHTLLSKGSARFLCTIIRRNMQSVDRKK